METIEGNKIIAEFMGGVDTGIIRDNSPLYNLPSPMWGNFDTTLRDMTYHCDWNWMMPVVEKITPLAKQMGQQAWFDVAHFFLSGNIEVVYQRVVDFIVWHNSTLLKQTT